MDRINSRNTNKSGLMYIVGQSQVPVPLKRVKIEVKVVDFIAQVMVIQEYENEEDHPIEVEYSFPVEESAAVVGFEAVMNGWHIVAEVKKKEKAQKDYAKAMRVSRKC